MTTPTKPQPATPSKPAPRKPSTRKTPAKASTAAKPTTPKTSTSKPAPKPAEAPKPNTQEIKRELATRCVEAIAAMVKGLPADDPIVKALGGRPEVARVAAHWVHHLPADRARWVKAGLPKPNRSDWR